jgi:hypothetical protein
MGRLPVGGLFIVLILFGALLFSFSSDNYALSSCISLMIINALNLIVFPFQSTLRRLQEGTDLNPWQHRWLKSQVVLLLVGTLGISLVLQ